MLVVFGVCWIDLPQEGGSCIQPGHIANTGQVVGSANTLPVTYQAGTITIITNGLTPFDPSYSPLVNTAVSNNLYGLIAFGSAGGGPSYLLTPITPYDETSSAITFSTGWTRVSRSGAYGGSVKVSSKSGSSAQLSFTGKSVALIGPTATTLGSANIYIDGAKVATVSENRTAGTRVRLFSKIFSVRGAHTIKVVVSGGTFDVDAFTVAPH